MHSLTHAFTARSNIPFSPSPSPSPSKRNTAWLEEKSGISSRETFFSLQQVSSCSFFLLSFFFPGVGKACCYSFLVGFLQAFSSGTQIGSWGMSGCPASFFLYPLGCKGLEASYDLLSALLYTPT